MKQLSSVRRRRSSGNALIEAAFVFLVLSVMLIAVFDCSQFLFRHQALVERARYAARWGAVTNADTISVQNMVMYYQSTVPVGVSNPFLGLDPSMVTATTSETGTNDAHLNVLIHDYPFLAVTPYLAGTHTAPPISISVPISNTTGTMY